MVNGALIKEDVIKVTLSGISGIMFEPFVGQEKDTRTPEQKFYYNKDGEIVLPAENIFSFLFAENPPGAAKSFEGKGSKEYIRMGQAHLVIEPELIPFRVNGKTLKFTGFDNETLSISEFSPRVKSGNLSIKQNLKQRPVIQPPWELVFSVRLLENPKIDRTKIFNWFSKGGILIGLGTYRPRFGRFTAKVE